MILDIDSACGALNAELINFIHNVIIIIKIAVPITLVIFGIIDFAKGVMANKDDEIKKGQGDFIKRLISGVVVFFMISITQLVISIIDKESDGKIWSCANAILSGNIYYINEEEREYDEHVKYCCDLIGGELDGKNVCQYNNNKGNDYDNCLKGEWND